MKFKKITENEVGGACGTCGGEEEHRQGCGGGIKERDHFEDLGFDGRILLKCMLKM